MFGSAKKLKELEAKYEALEYQVGSLNSAIDNFSYRLNTIATALAEHKKFHERLLAVLELQEVKVEAFTQIVKVLKL